MAIIKYRLGNTLDGDQTLSWGAKIKKKDPRKPNILKFQILQSIIPVLNDEVKYYDLDNNQVFGGYIQKITDNTGVQTIEVADYSAELGQERVSEVYENKSPEYIVEDLIDTYTDLTYVSTVSTGITIGKIVFKDAWTIDAINKMLELFSGIYNTDLNKNFNMSVMSSSTSTGILAYGTDTLQNGWKTDIQKKAEKVIVLGAIIDQRTTETLSGTNTVFNTSYAPENVEITGKQQTTESIDGDFTVNVQDKEITFESSQTDPVVSYTYKSQIRVELGTGKTVTLEKKYIESKLEARKLAIEYKNRFEDGVQNAKWFKNSSDIDTYTVGDLIYVTDAKNNKTGYYSIISVTLELPNKMIIEVGEEDDDLFDWQKETIERIRQLEATNQNEDFITKYDYLKNNVRVNMAVSFTNLKAIENSGAILWASDTTLTDNGDLISDTGVDEDFALAYDDYYMPVRYITDYINPWEELGTEEGEDIITEDGFTLVV